MNWLLFGAGIGSVWIAGVIYLTWWLRRPIKPPVPGEGGEPPRPAAPASPGGRRPPLAPGLAWTRITTTLEAECGCVHTLDPVARTRIRHECERHRFATEWDERLRRS